MIKLRNTSELYFPLLTQGTTSAAATPPVTFMTGTTANGLVHIAGQAPFDSQIDVIANIVLAAALGGVNTTLVQQLGAYQGSGTALFASGDTLGNAIQFVHPGTAATALVSETTIGYAVNGFKLAGLYVLPPATGTMPTPSDSDYKSFLIRWYGPSNEAILAGTWTTKITGGFAQWVASTAQTLATGIGAAALSYIPAGARITFEQTNATNGTVIPIGSIFKLSGYPGLSLPTTLCNCMIGTGATRYVRPALDTVLIPSNGMIVPAGSEVDVVGLVSGTVSNITMATYKIPGIIFRRMPSGNVSAGVI
jgi:hypothetical protein